MRVFTQDYMRAVLASAVHNATTPPAGILFGAKVGLYTNNPTINHHNVPGDFTEPSFTGYGQVTLTWSPALNAGDDAAKSIASDALFQPTANTGLPVAVNGVFVLDSTGAIVLWSEAFAAPFTFITSNDAVVYDADVTEPGQGTTGPLTA